MSDQQPPYGQQPHGQPYGQPYGQPSNPYGQPYGQPAYGHPSWGQPGYGAPAPGFRPDHPKSSSALGLGIVALAGGFALCGLPLVVGPFAWVTGARAVREIDREPQRWGGRGNAAAGMWMGIVSTVLLALGVVAIVAVIAIGVSGGFDPDTGPEPAPRGGVNARV